MSGARHAHAGSVAVIATVLFALFCLTAADAALAKKKKKALPPIHVRGTVYTFDDQTPIAGATVKVADLPGLSAQTGPDGTYDLQVSDGTRFTPYADAVGHHRIYLQTYVSQGKDLDRVNFQMPSDAAYNGLAAILSVPRDANNELVNCAVVSTFSTVNVRDASFNEFVAYGAHGVAGATASASPALPKPTYFNESVIPDASRTESSVDGGVVWPVVPGGVYRFTAHHPSTRFAPFRATCEPGRVVNANPPQGFYELRPGEQVDSTVTASLASTHFDLSGSKALLKARGPGPRVRRRERRAPPRQEGPGQASHQGLCAGEAHPRLPGRPGPRREADRGEADCGGRSGQREDTDPKAGGSRALRYRFGTGGGLLSRGDPRAASWRVCP